MNVRDYLEAQGWRRPGLDDHLFDATGRTLIPPALFVDLAAIDIVELTPTTEPAVLGEFKVPGGNSSPRPAVRRRQSAATSAGR